MENPIGLNGFAYVEYTGPDSQYLEGLFSKMGFVPVAKHRNLNVDLYRQGDCHFLLNKEPKTFAEGFAKQHGPSICSTGFRVENAERAHAMAVERGARPYQEEMKSATPFPAIYGIGDSLIHFVDPQGEKKLFEEEFEFTESNKNPEGFGFSVIDHLTNNVPVGEMQKWCDFYEKIFNFRETRFFDIKGEKTGLISKVMSSPCNKIIIPINEPTDNKSQIQEYIDEYKGSGIQHLALLTNDIVGSVKKLQEQGVKFLDAPPNTYYEALPKRIPCITEDLKTVQDHAVLIDGDDKGYLLQIFTQNVIGPIFYEIIQRKNHDGFGEGNFQALFDAIERDQERRGIL